MEGMAGPQDTQDTLCDMCYHVKFGSSASKGVCINRTELENWGERFFIFSYFLVIFSYYLVFIFSSFSFLFWVVR